MTHGGSAQPNIEKMDKTFYGKTFYGQTNGALICNTREEQEINKQEKPSLVLSIDS